MTYCYALCKDSQNKNEIVIHNYKLIIDRIYKQIENELPVKNAELIKNTTKSQSMNLWQRRQDQRTSPLLSLTRQGLGGNDKGGH